MGLAALSVLGPKAKIKGVPGLCSFLEVLEKDLFRDTFRLLAKLVPSVAGL